MKKKIIISLGIFSWIFFFGGIYMINMIEKTTAKLNEIIMLHQVEILRERLLIQIKRVQSDLSFKDTRFARSFNTIVMDVRSMAKAADTCSGCHHAGDVKKSLDDIMNQIGIYQDAISRVLTIRANAGRLAAEEDNALKTGEDLIAKVDSMIVMASSKLDEKTQAVLNKIARTKRILFIIIAASPLIATVLAFIFIKGFTKPMGKLLDATRKLKEGNLDYRIDGLKNEFGELAGSFNEMALSLKEYWSKLEESERKYRLLVENAKDAVFLLDAEGAYGKIIDANPAAAEMHGYSREELLNLNRKDLLAPDDAKKFDERFKKAIQDKRFVAESLHIRKNGTIFPVEVSANFININGHKYFLTFDRDITERKQAEAKLIRTEQMKLCGEMAASLAHEIKNPLAGIMASIEVLHDELNIAEKDRMVMKAVIEEIRRIETLLNELLIFARPLRPQMIPVNVNSIIESVLTMQAYTKDREIKVVKDLDESIPDITVDPMQIKQAILNLYANAVEAMSNGGSVLIRTSADEHRGMILIEVADTGPGITKDVKDKIFQPFFSTKAKGTGLGLAITRQIIEQNGGIIHACNNKEGGAVFTISLPFTCEHGGMHD